MLTSSRNSKTLKPITRRLPKLEPNEIHGEVLTSKITSKIVLLVFNPLWDIDVVNVSLTDGKIWSNRTPAEFA